MSRTQASTTARGYGRAHQIRQAQAIAQWKPGDPCARCGQPMWQRWTYSKTGKRISAIHLGHDDNDRTRYRGLEHAACNTGAAARKRNRMRRTTMRASTTRTPAARPPAAAAAFITDLRTSRRW